MAQSIAAALAHHGHSLSASLHHGSAGMAIAVVFLLLMLKVIAGNRG